MIQSAVDVPTSRDSAGALQICRPLRGLVSFSLTLFLGFRFAPPQALCCHPLRGLGGGLFASAIIHSAVCPKYPVCGVEETIRFHPPGKRTVWLRPALRDFLMESFDQFQLAGLALICLKNETKADAERTCAT